MRGRPNEGQPRVFTRAGEPRAFGEKTVAWMERVGLGLPRRVEQRLNIEVTRGWGRRSDMHRQIGRRDVRQPGVGVGVHRNALDAQFAARPNHAKRNFASICNEHPPNHSWTHFGLRLLRNDRRPS